MIEKYAKAIEKAEAYLKLRNEWATAVCPHCNATSGIKIKHENGGAYCKNKSCLKLITIVEGFKAVNI